MASGHVTALTGRTHGCTDQILRREVSLCQLGAVELSTSWSRLKAGTTRSMKAWQ